jgi:hypothetical protein
VIAQCPVQFKTRLVQPALPTHLRPGWRWRQALAGLAGAPAPAAPQCPAPWLLPRLLALSSDLAGHCTNAAGRGWSKVKPRERRSVPSSIQLAASMPASTAGPLHPAAVALLGVAILLGPSRGDLGLASGLMIPVAPQNAQACLHRPIGFGWKKAAA